MNKNVKNLLFIHDFYKMADNGKGLCEVRATANRKSGGEPISSKNHFNFFKFTKKMKWFFAGTAYQLSKISFNAASCKTHLYFASIKYIPEESKTERKKKPCKLNQI